MATVWRSCAKLSGKPSKFRENPRALLLRHSRAKDSKVSVELLYLVDRKITLKMLKTPLFCV